MMKLRFRVNHREVMVRVSPTRTLLDVLREDLGLTGTKKGCGRGDCGACTVLLDDRAVNACLILAPQTQDRRVMTIEGLARNGDLDDLQRAFVTEGAIQCGFCTPGMIMSAKALLLANPRPSSLEIKRAISGNICRCTGYAKIVRAIRKASRAQGTLLPGPGKATTRKRRIF
jgi:carbon-monoxide dehydrogenase small subunit